MLITLQYTRSVEILSGQDPSNAKCLSPALSGESSDWKEGSECKKKTLFLTGLLLCFVLMVPAIARAQGQAAFTDYRQHFYVFDKGRFMQLEHRPVLSYQVAKWGVAYQRNDGALMVYHNGVQNKLSEIVEDYRVTEGLLVYTINNNLFVYDEGQKTTLSMNAPRYKADENLVAYYDQIDKMFKVYYKGQIFDVESALSSPPVSDFKTGDNMVAYLDPNNYLQAFFEGATRRIMLAQGRTSYKVDRNQVVYFDVSLSSLQVFHLSGRQELAAFRPASYKVADERVAFVDNDGSLRLYENDQVKTLSSLTPEFYVLRDSLLIFEQQNALMAYYEGQIRQLENFIPSKIEYGFSVVAYLNDRNHLRVFQHGEQKTLSYEPVNQFEVFRDVVWFNVGVNSNKVYYNGEIY